METTPVNYDLPIVVAEALQTERKNGPSMRKTVCAAIHWYLHRLDPTQREQARREAKEWIETGEVPPAQIAVDAEAALNASPELVSKKARRKLPANSKGR